MTQLPLPDTAAANTANDPNVSNTPNTPTTATPAAQTQPQPPQPQSQQQPAMVSNAPNNAPAATDPNADHPAVRKASILRSVATALAGGPRYSVSVDPNTGQTVRAQAPLSKSSIGMAIALEAIQGSLTGMSQVGPGSAGRGGAMAFVQSQKEIQARNQAQEAQAQQDAKTQAAVLSRQANNTELASRAILNTAQAEKYGVDSLKSAVDTNQQLLSDYADAGEVSDSHVSQDALMEQMKSGKLDPTQTTAIPDGFTNINGKYEQTFSLVRNPNAKVPLSQSQWDTFAENNIRGFPKNTKIADGVLVPGTIVARANAQVQANGLMKQEIGTVQDTLAKSSDPANQELSKSIPDIGKMLSDPQTGATAQNALSKLQRYLSHSDLHGMDFYESLQQMAQPSKPDPNTKGQFIPNSDAPLANTIAGMFGNGDPQKGWQILQKYHEQITPTQIKSVAQAESILNDPASSDKDKAQAQAMLKTDTAQKAANKAATAGAGKGGAGTTGATPNADLVDQIGTGHMVAERMAYLLSRNPELMSQVSAKYPDFDSSKAQSYPTTYKDFTSGKTSVALNSGGTALSHLQELWNLNTPGSHIPHTPAWTAYQNKVDTVATELAKFYGDTTIPAIAGIKKTLDSTLPGNRQAAIRTQAQSMGRKLDAYQQQWDNAAPSKAYEAPMPGVSRTAMEARAFLDPSYTVPGSGGSGQSTNSPRNANAVPHGQQPPVPGAIAGRNAAGQIVAWKLPNGQIQRVN